MNEKTVINMLFSADEVEGQDVGSVYSEQVNLVKEDASDLFTAEINSGRKADIIHSRTIDPRNYLKMRNNKNASVRYAYFLPDTLNGSIQFPKALFSVFERHVINFYKTADYLIIVNPIFMKELEKYGTARERMIYIPNYVSKEQFHVKPVEQRNTIREQYGIKADEFVVIGVGQVRIRKDVLDFVDVVKKLPDVRFVWCGGFSFGKITDGYKELKKVVENPPTNVQSPGIIPKSDMNDIYNMADVLSTPPHDEPLPMAILEVVNLHKSMVPRSLELYEDILLKKYQTVDDNDSFAELTRRLHEDPAYHARCAAGSAYISEYYSKENVLSIWKEFHTRVYEKLQERKWGQKSAAFMLWQEGS